MIETFATLFTRDLNRLAQEIDAYTEENVLWQIAPGISNSAGNLCLHLLGNLTTYVGVNLGQSTYIRDRDREFSDRNIAKAELLIGIKTLQQLLETTFSAMTDARLGEPYPVDVLGYPMTIHYFLTHLSGHLNYHLGQIDYHRRLLTGGQRVAFTNR